MSRGSQPERKIAVIPGTSRDVGAFTAICLAQAGFDIVGLYRNPDHEQDQQEIINIVKRSRARMDVVQADLVDLRTPGLIADKLDGRKIHALVCNAAGGYGNTLGAAREINIWAQVRLVNRLLGNFADGGVLIYPNSEAGHRYHLMGEFERESLGAYRVVAQSKNESEHYFRSEIPKLERMGISYRVVVANALKGTFVERVLRRSHPHLVNNWQEITPEGLFPTATDMASVIGKVVRGHFPSGHTEYLGVRLANGN